MTEPTAKTFFSREEQARIEAAVRAAEQHTSGEIVPMVVDQSYDYPRVEILGGGLLSLALAATLSWAFGQAVLWWFLPLFALGYFPFKWLIRALPSLKRRLIRPEELAAEVEERAMLAFVEQGVYRTRDGTGILILISLFEHRVHVLAGHGINGKVPQETWDEIVRLVTAGIRSGRACDALCAAIERCGALLQEQFPRKTDDSDELPNLILP